MKINVKKMKRVGKWFLELPKEAKISMATGLSDASIENCGSPACFGGWLAVYYNTKIYKNGKRKYMDGANAFARALGFKKSILYSAHENLKNYVSMREDLWRDSDGYGIFIRPSTFNEGGKEYDKDNITPRAIGEKLLAVANRIEEEGESYEVS